MYFTYEYHFTGMIKDKIQAFKQNDEILVEIQ